MTEYLITVSGSADLLLKSARRKAFSTEQAAIDYAKSMLERHRQQYLGGTRWDTWAVALPRGDAFTATPVASGRAERA